MTRLWENTRQGQEGEDDPFGAPEADDEAELDEPEGLLEHYDSRPIRPASQAMARLALWGLIVLGFLAGVVGLIRSGNTPAPVVPDTGAGDAVPGPAAGMAEVVATEWLTADVEDEDRIGQLFVDPPDLEGTQTDRLAVRDAVAVGGRQVEDGYWAVTVAVAVDERVEVRAEGEDEPQPETRSTTWYIEVGIVGDEDGSFAALSTPSFLPAPPAADTIWQPNQPRQENPTEEDEPLITTAEGFLNALLAGEGDVARYLAPRVAVAPADPPIFERLDIMTIASVELEEGARRVWVRAQATTVGGSSQVVAYEMVLTEHVDRWEVAHFQGAPEVIQRQATESADEPAAVEEGDDTEEGEIVTTETTAATGTTEAAEEDRSTGDEDDGQLPDEDAGLSEDEIPRE